MNDGAEGHHTTCNLCGGSDAEAIDDALPLVRCRRCGLAYLDPQPDDGALAQVYGEDYYTRPIDPGGPSYIENREGLERFFESRLRRIERFVRPGRLLEVGAGLGYYLNVAVRRGWSAVGFETSEFAARYAQENFGLDVRQQALDATAFGDASFDAVVMRDLVEHVREPRALLLEAGRILRDGGLLALSMPNFGSVGARLGGRHWRHLRPEQHLYHFTPETIGRLLSECGFRVVEETSRYDSPAAREVYAALDDPAQRRQLAWHAAVRGDIVFLPLGSWLRRLLRAAAIVLSCFTRPFRDRLRDDILEVLALRPEASR
jgi:SAM-dependent methyltransferase